MAGRRERREFLERVNQSGRLVEHATHEDPPKKMPVKAKRNVVATCVAIVLQTIVMERGVVLGEVEFVIGNVFIEDGLFCFDIDGRLTCSGAYWPFIFPSRGTLKKKQSIQSTWSNPGNLYRKV